MEPPKPDFQRRLNYVQWHKGRLRFADADNAWQEYRKFAEPRGKVQIPEAAEQQLEALLDSPKPWNDEFPELASWLKSVAQQLDAYVAGTRHEYFAGPFNEKLQLLSDIYVPPDGFPWARPSRLLSKAMIAKAWQADGSFDGGGFVESLGLITRHANHMGQGLTLMDQMLALSLRDSVWCSVLEAIHRDVLAAADIRRLETLLEETDSHNCVTALGRCLPGERALAYEAVQTGCVHAGAIGPRFSRETALEGMRWAEQTETQFLTEGQLERLLMEDPKELVRQIEDFYDRIQKELQGESVHNLDGFIEGEYAKLVADSVFFRKFGLDVLHAFTLAIRGETARRGVRVMLAVKRYHHENGVWPANFDDPVLGLSRTIRGDPRSTQSLVYRAENGAVVLYSVGRDGTDNGGTQLESKYAGKPGEDLVIWPLQRRNAQ